jgi:uncharacterized OB-fold protein
MSTCRKCGMIVNSNWWICPYCDNDSERVQVGNTYRTINTTINTNSLTVIVNSAVRML